MLALIVWKFSNFFSILSKLFKIFLRLTSHCKKKVYFFTALNFSTCRALKSPGFSIVGTRQEQGRERGVVKKRGWCKKGELPRSTPPGRIGRNLSRPLASSSVIVVVVRLRLLKMAKGLLNDRRIFPGSPLIILMICKNKWVVSSAWKSLAFDAC